MISAHAEEGLSARAAGERFGIGPATAIRWVRYWRETREVQAPPRKARSSRLDPHRDWLIAWRLADPDARLVNLAVRFETEQSIGTDMSTL